MRGSNAKPLEVRLISHPPRRASPKAEDSWRIPHCASYAIAIAIIVEHAATMHRVDHPNPRHDPNAWAHLLADSEADASAAGPTTPPAGAAGLPASPWCVPITSPPPSRTNSTRSSARWSPASGANPYAFDFVHCPAARGWAQIDTSQDAPWFGTWTHPETLRIVRFIEGEMTVRVAATAAEYVAEMRRQVAWHAGQGHAFAIDSMLRDDIEAQLRALGLGDLLH